MAESTLAGTGQPPPTFWKMPKKTFIFFKILLMAPLKLHRYIYIYIIAPGKILGHRCLGATSESRLGYFIIIPRTVKKNRNQNVG